MLHLPLSQLRKGLPPGSPVVSWKSVTQPQKTLTGVSPRFPLQSRSFLSHYLPA